MLHKAQHKKSSTKHNSVITKKKTRPASRLLTISNNDTVYSLLQKHGFESSQVGAVLQHPIWPPNFTLVPGNLYKVTQNLASHRLEVKFYDPHEDRSYVFWRQGDKVGCYAHDEHFIVHRIHVSGTVNGSLVASIRRHVDSSWIAYRFLDAYLLDYNIKHVLQRGARFSLVYEKKYDGSQFIKYGEVLQTALQIDGEMQMRRFVPFKSGGSFVKIKESYAKRPFYAPVDYIHISSPFERRRFHPIKKRYVAHLGVDFVMDRGQDIYAVYAGRVLRTGRNHAAGRFVVLQHSNGLQSFYDHMSRVANGIVPGRFVSTGQVIGYVGCSGYCTKPHLHFAIKKHGRYVNPVHFIKSFAFLEKPVVQKAKAWLATHQNITASRL